MQVRGARFFDAESSLTASPVRGAGLLVGVADVRLAAREETVNVLLEAADADGHARFASHPRGRAWADELLRSMEQLSVLLYKLVVSFLISETNGGPVIGTLQLDTAEPH